MKILMVYLKLLNGTAKEFVFMNDILKFFGTAEIICVFFPWR